MPEWIFEPRFSFALQLGIRKALKLVRLKRQISDTDGICGNPLHPQITKRSLPQTNQISVPLSYHLGVALLCGLECLKIKWGAL